MAKPEPWRLALPSYPFATELATRFSDLDPLGHVNNVRMAEIFESGRIMFHRQLGRHPRDQGLRWLVAAVSLNYVAEAHYPDPVVIASGLGKIGTTSWTILSAAFQNGACVATCDTVMVAQGPEGRRVIGDDVRAMLAPHFVAAPSGRSMSGAETSA